MTHQQKLEHLRAHIQELKSVMDRRYEELFELGNENVDQEEVDILLHDNNVIYGNFGT